MPPTTDARSAKATERIIRNLTDSVHPWSRQLSALFGVDPLVALAALRVVVDAGTVESRIVDGAHHYRRA